MFLNNKATTVTSFISCSGREVLFHCWQKWHLSAQVAFQLRQTLFYPLCGQISLNTQPCNSICVISDLSIEQLIDSG
jgi:hypothetical protein